LFYSDDYYSFQYGGDPLTKLQKSKSKKKNQEIGQKVDETKNNDWLQKAYP
jgi:hypothetical protein